MWTTAPPAKLTILPRVSRRLRTPAPTPRHGSAAGAFGGAGRIGVATAMAPSPQHVVGVEQRQHRGCVQVLEDLDAQEARHYRLVHCACHPHGATARGHTYDDAHGGAT